MFLFPKRFLWDRCDTMELLEHTIGKILNLQRDYKQNQVCKPWYDHGKKKFLSYFDR